MFLVHYFNQAEYQFVMSLHTTRGAAESAFEALLRRYRVSNTMDSVERPEAGSFPKEKWGDLFDDSGEGVHLYEIECDGGPAQQIWLGASKNITAA